MQTFLVKSDHKPQKKDGIFTDTKNSFRLIEFQGLLLDRICY